MTSTTKFNRIANVCLEDPSHPKFKEVDGGRCVECNAIVTQVFVTEEEYRALPSYRELCEERKQKAKPKQSLSIAVDVSTDKLQLKLRAIAKHTEALANELDAIDSEGNEQSDGYTAPFTIVDETVEIPTRFEGSD